MEAHFMTDTARKDALKALKAIFEQAKDAPEMSLDEINAEIAAVRAERKNRLADKPKQPLPNSETV